MDPLIEGYRKFRAETWPAERARYEALAHWGQSPEAMVIACSDSRVDPQTVFGAAPGELFVLRNVAARSFAANPRLQLGERVLFLERRQADHHRDAEAKQRHHALLADPKGERQRSDHVRPLEARGVDALADDERPRGEAGWSDGYGRGLGHE